MVITSRTLEKEISFSIVMSQGSVLRPLLFKIFIKNHHIIEVSSETCNCADLKI